MQQSNLKASRVILLACITMLAISFASCARKLTFGTSNVVPAAEGYVKIKSDKNRNNVIELSVRNLADPKRLNPPRRYYVVWMETQSNGTKNIGTLTSSSGIFSSKLKSSLKTVTPFKPTGFLITAEDNSTAQFPGGYVVMRTN